MAEQAVTVPGYRAAWSAPTWKLMLETFEEFVALLAPLTSRLSREERRIKLTNNSVLEFWSSLDPSAGRSRKYHRWVSDETQKQRSLDAFIKGSVRPSLADYRGELWVLGTPNGEGSEFHNFYLECQRQEEFWQIHHGTLDDNPYIHPDEIRQMRVELGPQMAAQEIDAQWVRIDGVAPLVQKAIWDTYNVVPNEQSRSRKVLALDAAIASDTNGLIGVWRDRLTYQYTIDFEDIHIFNQRTRDGETDFIELEEVIVRMWQQGQFSALVYDPYQCVGLAQRLRRRGVRCIEFTQNSMRLKADSYLKQVLTDGLLNHPGHPDLDEHVLNATIKYSGNQNSIRIVKSSPSKKIDLAVALSMAVYTLSTIQDYSLQEYTPAVVSYAQSTVDIFNSASYSPLDSKRFDPFAR